MTIPHDVDVKTVTVSASLLTDTIALSNADGVAFDRDHEVDLRFEFCAQRGLE